MGEDFGDDSFPSSGSAYIFMPKGPEKGSPIQAPQLKKVNESESYPRGTINWELRDLRKHR